MRGLRQLCVASHALSHQEIYTMKNRGRHSQHSPPPQEPQQGDSALDEAQALFERMKSEAIGQAELERKAASSRGPLLRLLLVLTIVACLIGTVAMLYGVYNFPDAPIRRTESGYVGKGGKPRTQDDFEAFIFWEKAMFIVIPSVFILGLAFVITDSMQRRKRIQSSPEKR